MFNLEQLNTIRSVELAKVVSFLPPRARILEIGAGTGQQALELSRLGFDVTAVEIPSSNYREARVFPILDYDGSVIPAGDRSFDVVFSSNVLEHVPHLSQLNREIRRVLKADGYAIHILPTHSWRFWTTISAFPTALQYVWALRGKLVPHAASRRELGRLLLAANDAYLYLKKPFRQDRHGERGNVLSETWLFHPSWWRNAFRRDGFEIVADEPIGFFYTGNMTLGSLLPVALRKQLSTMLGSACHLFQVRPIDRG